MTLTSRLTEIDLEIRRGESHKAEAALESLFRDYTAIELRPHYWLLGQYLRRLGYAERAVRLLYSAIRGPNAQPTAQELGEYGISLLHLGAVTEAKQILDLVDLKKYPRARLYIAFTLFNMWEYGEAEPILKQLYEIEEGYSKTVAGVNWLTCLSYTRQWEFADELSQSLKTQIQASESQVLLGNIYEIETQMHIFKRELKLAENKIAAADQLLKGPSRFYLERWKALIPYFKSRANLTLLDETKRQAFARGDFESVRVMDFHAGEYFSDESIFPLSELSYFAGVKKITNLFFGERPPQTDLIYQHELTRLELGMNSAILELEEIRPDLKLTTKEWDLIRCLMSDRYRLHQTPSLFHHVTGGDHFNPLSSPNVIHQLINRTRMKLKNTPLQILWTSQGGYYLETPKHLQFKASVLRSRISPKLETFYDKLKTQFGDEVFTLKKASALAPERTALRFLKTLIQEQKLKKLSTGKYQL